MNPDLSLGVVAALAGFLLKTSVAFGVALVLSRLVDSPGRRFLIWSALLYGMAGYWLWLARDIFAGAHQSWQRWVPILGPSVSTARAFEIPGFVGWAAWPGATSGRRRLTC